MKKLLLILPIVLLTISACGPSDEEKAKIQQEYQEQVDRKVNEIMEKLEESNKPVVVKNTNDSTVADTITIAEE